MATEKFISFPSCRAFLPAIRRLARIAQALQSAASRHPRDRTKKSRRMTAGTACRELVAHARQGGAA